MADRSGFAWCRARRQTTEARMFMQPDERLGGSSAGGAECHQAASLALTKKFAKEIETTFDEFSARHRSVGIQ